MTDAEHEPWYDQEYKNNVLLDLNRERFEADSFCDATLKVGRKSFKVHKCVVGKVSPFFRKLFKVKMMETESSFANIKGLSSKVMKSILNYIYTGTVKINDGNVFDLLAASEYLLIDQLKSCCQVYLRTNVDIATCIKYHSIAKAKKWILLERKAENIINQNYKELIKQKEFTAMEKEDAILFFSALNQNASAFVVKDVYDVVMTWVRHDVELRKQFLPELLKLVKFRHLPEMFLKKLKKENLFKDLVQVGDMLDEELQWKGFCNEGHRSKNQFALFDKEQIELFDVFTKTWTKLPLLPNDVTGSCAVKMRNYLYVIGGKVTPKMIQRLNLNEEEAHWEFAGNTLQERIDPRAIVVNDMIVISGGTFLDDHGIYVEYYDDNYDPYGTNTVESFSMNGSKVQQVQMQPMSIPRYNHSMVNCKGTMYCFGWGWDPSYIVSEKYENHSWKSLYSSRHFSFCAAVATNDEIFVIDAIKERLYHYAVKLDEWKKLSTIPAALNAALCQVCYMEGKVFVFGMTEFNNQEVNSPTRYALAEYDVAQNAWQISYSIPCISDDSYILAV